MALVSSKVATGAKILADHINKLWTDMTQNHDHDGDTTGAKVDHLNLLESQTGNMSGMNHRHQDLEYHLLGGGPGANEIDNPGGDRGVHGLAAAAFVAGAFGYKIGDIFTAGQLVFQAGYVACTGDNGSVTFGVAFDTIIGVIATSVVATLDMDDRDVFIESKSVSGFDWHCHYKPDGFTWLAIGLKS